MSTYSGTDSDVRPAALTVHQDPAGDGCVLRVSGELDLATAALLVAAVDRAAAECADLELDLGGLAFCDVVGLGALSELCARLPAEGHRLTLRGSPAPSIGLLLGVPGAYPLLGPLRTAGPEVLRSA